MQSHIQFTVRNTTYKHVSSPCIQNKNSPKTVKLYVRMQYHCTYAGTSPQWPKGRVTPLYVLDKLSHKNHMQNIGFVYTLRCFTTVIKITRANHMAYRCGLVSASCTLIYGKVTFGLNSVGLWCLFYRNRKTRWFYRNEGRRRRDSNWHVLVLALQLLTICFELCFSPRPRVEQPRTNN